MEMGQEKIFGMAKTGVIFLSFHSVHPSYDISYKAIWMYCFEKALQLDFVSLKKVIISF